MASINCAVYGRELGYGVTSIGACYCHRQWKTTNIVGGGNMSRVSFSFLAKGEGGGKGDCIDYWGGKYVSVCKAWGKLGGSGGMLPRGNVCLFFDLLVDAIWWNLGLFFSQA